MCLLFQRLTLGPSGCLRSTPPLHPASLPLRPPPPSLPRSPYLRLSLLPPVSLEFLLAPEDGPPPPQPPGRIASGATATPEQLSGHKLLAASAGTPYGEASPTALPQPPAQRPARATAVQY